MIQEHDGAAHLRLAVATALHARGIEHVWMDDATDHAEGGEGPVLVGITPQSPGGTCNLLGSYCASEGGRTTMTILQVAGDASGLPITTALHVAGWADHVAAVRRREDALRSAGHRAGDAPAWSLGAHPLLHHLVLRDHPDIDAWLDTFEWRPNPHGWWGENGRPDTPKIARHGGRLLVHAFQSRATDWSDEGSLSFEETEQRDGGEKSRIQTLIDRKLPETIVTGAGGTDLASLVAIRGVPNPSGILIESIEQTDDPVSEMVQIDIHLQPLSVPLAPAPAGMRRDWLPCIDRNTYDGASA